jgi:hypothetical protein
LAGDKVRDVERVKTIGEVHIKWVAVLYVSSPSFCAFFFPSHKLCRVQSNKSKQPTTHDHCLTMNFQAATAFIVLLFATMMVQAAQPKVCLCTCERAIDCLSSSTIKSYLSPFVFPPSGTNSVLAPRANNCLGCSFRRAFRPAILDAFGYAVLFAVGYGVEYAIGLSLDFTL